MIYFTIDDVLFIHSELIEKYGGIHGIKNQNMLESAIFTPLQTFNGIDLYHSTIEKISRLSYGLVRNHPFWMEIKELALKYSTLD